MNEGKTKKKKFSMPHAYVIMIIIIALSMVLTWVLPAGSFQYEYNEELDRDLRCAGKLSACGGTVSHRPLGNGHIHL